MRKNNPEFDGPFAPMCEMYVKQKRALGFKYEGGIWILRAFDNFAKDFDVQNFKLTKELAYEWCQKRPNESKNYHNGRIYEMRKFAEFLVKQGYESYMPRLKLQKDSHHTPYIFTLDEMSRLFNQLDQMTPTPCSPYKHLSFPLLYRMLYGCGLRISEALNLTLRDIDTQSGMIRIDNGKNNKERLVPMGSSLLKRCERYIFEVHQGHGKTHNLIFSRDGKPYSVSNIDKHFRDLMWDADIPYCGRALGPRVHDIRHTFVCHRLNKWVREDADLMTMLPVLSRFLGHENVSGTQWYLRLTAEAYPDITSKMNELTGYVFPEVGGEYYDSYKTDGFCIYAV
jgi:integrase